ncbi:MAG: hypothetical protein WBO47_14135 [Gammaproteobacteria bacterium]
MRYPSLRVVIGALLLSLAVSANAFVVSNYKVNGQKIYDGMTYDEVRAIAGDPTSENALKPNDQLVEWNYQCSTPGHGPCTVVSEGGKRRMRALFTLGRLTSISFEPM